MHIVRAQTTLAQVTYLLDTPEVDVQVARGGTVGPVMPHSGGMFRVDIALGAPLEPGQTTALETIAVYPPGCSALDHVRRSPRATAGGVSLEVQFDVAAVPQRVRWTELGVVVPAELLVQPVGLSPDHAIHRFLTPAQDCAVGFEWDW